MAWKDAMAAQGVAVAMPIAGRVARMPAGAFARVEVHGAAAPVLEAWAELERVSPCSIYQTRAWLLPWLDTLGRGLGVTPLLVLARAADGTPTGLLNLGLTRRGPIRVAGWLGGKDANFNMPLLRPEAPWTPAEVARLLREARRGLGRDAPDVFALANQPFAWQGYPNPLAAFPHQASPSAAYGTALPRDAETLFAAKLSKSARKKMRNKEKRLAALGPLVHEIATSAVAREEVVDAFLAMKVERFRAQRIVSTIEWPEMRAFMTTASAGPGLELHALRVGARIAAVFGGAAHDGQWSGMFNAFDADPEIARFSPGEALLMRIVAKACVDGLARFDLGIGEAHYKDTLCDEEIAMFDAFVAMTWRGRLFTATSGTLRRLKRIVKRNPRLFALARRVNWLLSRSSRRQATS